MTLSELTVTNPEHVARMTAAEAYTLLASVTKEEALKLIRNVEATPLQDGKPGEHFYRVIFEDRRSAIVNVRLIKPTIPPSGQSADFYSPVDMDWGRT